MDRVETATWLYPMERDHTSIPKYRTTHGCVTSTSEDGDRICFPAFGLPEGSMSYLGLGVFES